MCRPINSYNMMYMYSICIFKMFDLQMLGIAEMT